MAVGNVDGKSEGTFVGCTVAGLVSHQARLGFTLQSMQPNAVGVAAHSVHQGSSGVALQSMHHGSVGFCVQKSSQSGVGLVMQLLQIGKKGKSSQGSQVVGSICSLVGTAVGVSEGSALGVNVGKVLGTIVGNSVGAKVPHVVGPLQLGVARTRSAATVITCPSQLEQ